jgi:hypothetical protein
MANYTSVRDSLGFASDQQFRDALIACGINPKQAAAKGLTDDQVLLLSPPQKSSHLISASAEINEPPADHLGEPTVSIEAVQRKLGVDPETMVHLCREFGLSENRPLAQAEAMALCELAIEVYGVQLQEELDFVSDRQALLFQQQQNTAFQLGYLQEANIDAATQRGRLEARKKRLGKQEREVRQAQEQVFGLLSQAGKSITTPEKPPQTASEAHQVFAAGLWG